LFAGLEESKKEIRDKIFEYSNWLATGEIIAVAQETGN